MINLFWSVFGLGLVFFASPGPINIETVRRGVHSGPWPAFAVQVGAIIAEIALGVAVMGGIAPFIQQPSVQWVLTVLSAGVLGWIAWGALRPDRTSFAPLGQRRAAHYSMTVGVVAAASNPLGVMMWLVIAGVAPASGIALLQPVHVVIIGVGYLLGALTWAVLITVIVGWSRRFVQPRVWRWWNIGSGVLLGGFALHLVCVAAAVPVDVSNYFLTRSYQ